MRLDPERVVYKMGRINCKKCGEEQWCFFTNPQEIVQWVCPCEKVGNEKITEPVTE